MSSARVVVIGILLGAVGGAFHLAVTRWRATLVTTRGVAAALLTMPIGLFGIGALVFVAAKVSPLAAWVSPLGILAVRLAILGRKG